ncbi:hypothetical protein BDQ12DRAFT_1976 [Crucibulum laeve]|uniref:Uncharacterized protein n=1 Tax=Crucibulum laeve TaxID=68775 RepID=A0A5C3MHC5_9AGAR|nr:hypothetical protein BDQ12DRAFT_1976 [Crucibulum laeve]
MNSSSEEGVHGVLLCSVASTARAVNQVCGRTNIQLQSQKLDVGWGGSMGKANLPHNQAHFNSIERVTFLASDEVEQLHCGMMFW